MPNPKISVVMSVYNGEKYFREAIDSILNQTLTDFEFIIVNDDSTDSSLEIIQSYHDERIKIINNEKNIGLTRSLNIAIEQAQGEFIARQDADDISLPNRFEEQLKYLEQHQEVALLGTSIQTINEDGKITGKRTVLANPTKSLVKVNPFKHGSTMFRSGIVRELGGYNELFRYGQDYELWLRIASYYEVRNLTQVLYKLRSHDEAIRFKYGDESALYRLLALRLARNDLDAEVVKAVKNNGIKSLYPYLDKHEKVYFNKNVAFMYMHNNNMKLAREEYRKVLRLNPLNVKTYVNIILSYLGKGAWTTVHRLYEVLRYS